jgi:hypothetical protein
VPQGRLPLVAGRWHARLLVPDEERKQPDLFRKRLAFTPANQSIANYSRRPRRRPSVAEAM